LPSHELALPMILMNGVPQIVGGLGLAAVFSAEISAADAGLFMLTTSLSQDLYKRFLNPAADDRRILAITRSAAIVCGAAAVALAIVSPTIIGVIGIFYGLLGVSLFVPILAGLYSRRAGTPEALASIFAGISTMIAVQFVTSGRGVVLDDLLGVAPVGGRDARVHLIPGGLVEIGVAEVAAFDHPVHMHRTECGVNATEHGHRCVSASDEVLALGPEVRADRGSGQHDDDEHRDHPAAPPGARTAGAGPAG
jgi:Na+(H+)/acetate symporter ActP